MFWKKLFAAVSAVALGLSMCGCRKTPTFSEPDTEPVLTPLKSVSRGADGSVDITRRDLGDTPMGEDGTWTVFVYISGSTLEEWQSSASADLNEMLEASTGKNMRFIVQTGGSRKWNNDYVNADYIERWEISNGKRTRLAQLPLVSLAEGATVRNFLKWGVENYPAARMGVIFWGHGMGTVTGVCRDSLFKGDFLPLSELNSALSEVSGIMTDKFEFIGFDACYMATAETADVVCSYADYMIASEDLEPSNGWDYTLIGSLFGENPNADWNTIAKTFCDGFIEQSSDSKRAELVTLSVVDLSKFDEVSKAMDKVSGELYAAINTEDDYIRLEQALWNTGHFGEDNAFEGYGNIADIGDFARAAGGFTKSGAVLLDAMDKAVICKRAGKYHENAAGLTVYYPFEPAGLSEQATFSRLCVSPNYLAFIDRRLRAKALAPDTSDRRESITEHWLDDMNNGTKTLEEYYSYSENTEKNEDSSEVSGAVKFSVEPNFKDGAYSLTLEPNSLEEIRQVGLNVYYAEKFNKFQFLGTRTCENADLAAGTFSDEFDGKWYLLADRQPIQIKRQSDGNFLTQMTYSDTESAVIFSAENNSARIISMQKPDEYNIPFLQSANAGDVIAPIREICTIKGDKFSAESGAEYTLQNGGNIIYDTLNDGYYICMLVIEDVWGGRYETEMEEFAIIGGVLDFTRTIDDIRE